MVIRLSRLDTLPLFVRLSAKKSIGPSRSYPNLTLSQLGPIILEATLQRRHYPPRRIVRKTFLTLKYVCVFSLSEVFGSLFRVVCVY